MVEPAGPACHTGERSCFHKLLTPPCEGRGHLSGGSLEIPENGVSTTRLKLHRPAPFKGTAEGGTEVGEEGVETALAVAVGDRKETICEAADSL